MTLGFCPVRTGRRAGRRCARPRARRLRGLPVSERRLSIGRRPGQVGLLTARVAVSRRPVSVVPRAAPKGGSGVRSPTERRACGGGTVVPRAAPIPPRDARSPMPNAGSPTRRRVSHTRRRSRAASSPCGTALLVRMLRREDGAVSEPDRIREWCERERQGLSPAPPRPSRPVGRSSGRVGRPTRGHCRSGATVVDMQH